MITVKKISKAELPKLVEISYMGDDEMFDKYHNLVFDKVPYVNFYSAVLSTLQLIHETSKEIRCSYYKIIADKQPIGFFVTFDGYLYSFGMAMKYRKKEYLIQWFNSVKKVLGKNFRAMLYDNNTRAISHLEKQGMKIIDIDPETKIVTLQN